MHLGETVAM